MFGAAQPLLLKFPLDRGIFLREYATQTYGAAPYFISKSLVVTRRHLERSHLASGTAADLRECRDHMDRRIFHHGLARKLHHATWRDASGGPQHAWQ